MSLEVTGKLIAKYDAQQVSEKFKKREFVLELAEEINGNIYTNFAKLQLVQNKCDIIDRFKEGEQVRVSFNIKGNRWERDGKVNYITNLDAWRVESASAAPSNNNNSGGNNSNQGGNNNNSQGGTPAYNNNGGNNNSGGGNYNGTANFNPSPETIDDLPF